MGILTSNFEIDVPRMQIIRDVSRPLLLTFHRAFDVCTTDVEESISQIMSFGCDRLLTSGRFPTAEAGQEMLHRVVAARDNFLSKHPNATHMRVIAAAGVSVSNAGNIITHGAVDGVHAGSAVTVKGRGKVEAEKLPKLPRDQSECLHAVSEEGHVRSRLLDGNSDMCVKDFNDDLCAGVVSVEEVSRLVNEAEAAWSERLLAAGGLQRR